MSFADRLHHDAPRALELRRVGDRQLDLLAGAVGEAPQVVLALHEGLAVDRHQPLAGLHPQVGPRERRAHLRVGEVAAVDLPDLPEAARGVVVEVGGEEAGAHRLAAPHVAAPVVGVADVQLAEHLAQHVGEVVARGDAVGERAVLLPHAVPVDAVHLRVVEEVALQPPGLVQHLLPLVARVDAGPTSRRGRPSPPWPRRPWAPPSRPPRRGRSRPSSGRRGPCRPSRRRRPARRTRPSRASPSRCRR